MNLIRIDDPRDRRLDPYRDLRQEDVRFPGEWFIAEGKLVVQRLLASDYPLVSVLAEEKRLAWVATRTPAEAPVLVVPPGLIRQVAGFNFHRGLLACGRRLPIRPAEQLLGPMSIADEATEAAAPQRRLALGLIAINDLENLGSLIRTAAAFGIRDIALSRQTVDPLSRRVLRVSMGAALRMRYFDWKDPANWLADNARRGQWWTIATTLADDALPLDRLAELPESAGQSVMLLLGNEGQGLPEPIQLACDVRALIPMAPAVDSLNVAVAGAIAIYELRRSVNSSAPARHPAPPGLQ